MKKYAVFLLIIVCIIFSACTAQPQTIYLSPKQVAEILSKATCETTSNQEGRIFISAIFQTDED